MKKEEIRAIKDAVKTHFGESARVFLFGSRTDDSKRGCETDLLVEHDSVLEGSEKATIESSLRECDSHLSKCRRALGLLEPLFPLSMDSFSVLPSLYSFVENDARPQPFLTILSRLEQLSVLTSTEDWKFFRNLSNNLAHDYPESVEQTVESLNTLYSEFESFAGMYLQVREYWFSKFSREPSGGK